MAKQVLDHVDIDALLQKMRGKAMSERVHRYRRIETSGVGGIAERALHWSAS